VLADLIDPHAYFALPFTNQAWFVAACCYLKGGSSRRRRAWLTAEIEQQQGELGAAPDHSKTPTPKSEDQDTITDPMDVDADPNPPAAVAASRTLLASVATTNITTLQQGLSKLAEYWYGAEWIAGALAQRVQGIQERDVDLVSVREGFDSFVSVPDGGVVAAAQVEGEGDGEGEEGEGDEGEEGEDDDEDAEVATVDPAVDPTVVAATPTAPPPAEPEPPAALDFLSLPLPFDLTSDADLFSAWVQTHA
jgi:hypothetical protein